ncbi:unnamed protein product [Ambrosiozyma monospora]|uniref:Unnamed protein product n=1 Tax=Ambrosiozyma monospora TaxID=43982 RepID=A0A9W7DK15_AMBMO|nr:unnamed protein product [Ambrosiozyma monospora]
MFNLPQIFQNLNLRPHWSHDFDLISLVDDQCFVTRIDETCCLDEKVKQILVDRLGVADAIRNSVPDVKQRMDATRRILATLRETNNDPEAPQITSLMKALRMTAGKTAYFAKMSAAKR